MKRRRVALLVETSLMYGRELLEGIASYFEQHSNWSLFLDQRELGGAPPAWFAHRHWDGVLTRVTTPRLAAAIRRLKVAAVDLTDRSGNLKMPRILSDHEGIGRLGAEHLLDRSFTQFAFCGYEGEAWSESRLKGFQATLQERGFDCEIFRSIWTGHKALEWDREEQQVGRWLKSLPRPLGIMACNDQRGQQVLESCRRVGLRVPEEIAVVGVDNDRVFCRLCDPPLSSVVPDARHVGYLAAATLDRMMSGESVAPVDYLVPPLRVVARSSSDTLAVKDRELQQALRLIQERACQGLTVPQLLRSVAVSRSLLERRFRDQLGRTPHAQIRRVQMERVFELLTETDLPLKQIAALSGFSHLEYLSYYFKKAQGMTLGEYRKRHGAPTRGFFDASRVEPEPERATPE